MITKEQLEEWTLKANHWNFRENLGKTRQLLLEVLEVVRGDISDGATSIRTPEKVSGDSKGK
jgi:hypothetical protein